MTHLMLSQLLRLREPGVEPGDAAAREHLARCPACQEEMDRLHQRVARLKAMPPLRPPRDRFPAVRAQVVAHRRRRLVTRTGLGSLALAASVMLAVLLTEASHPMPAQAANPDLSAAMAESQLLEQALHELDPDARLTDGHTARIAGALEDRIAAVDRKLEAAQLQPSDRQSQELGRLWRERVGLMDALVNVHVTQASNVGL